MKPGPHTLPAATVKALQGLEAFQALRREGKVAVVNRPAKIPWERMHESVRRLYQQEQDAQRRAASEAEKQAQLRRAFDDAWQRVLQTPIPSRAEEPRVREVQEQLRAEELKIFRQVQQLPRQ